MQILGQAWSSNNDALEFILRFKKFDMNYALTYLKKINKGIEIPIDSV